MLMSFWSRMADTDGLCDRVLDDAVEQIIAGQSRPGMRPSLVCRWVYPEDNCKILQRHRSCLN